MNVSTQVDFFDKDDALQKNCQKMEKEKDAQKKELNKSIRYNYI